MSNNRYSALNRRAPPASSLFQDYPGQSSSSRPSSSSSHTRPSYASNSDLRSSSPYLNNSSNNNNNPYAHANGNATPNQKDHHHPYSTSVLEQLESQNDTTATTLLSQKVSQLKSMTIAIGDEIRDSSAFASQINESFENTSVKLRGTMRRMLRMAERTGVGWKVWVLVLLGIWVVFAYVWLF